RIERAAIAAATPITYHSKELLLLIHEHLQASGLSTAASALLKEAQLTPLPSLAAPSSLAYQTSARDDTIAHILTKLQVGKKLSELIRDSGSQTPGGEQGRWQKELSQVAIELMAIVTNPGRASTLAATDAATPT
nr:DDB1- and CUL4-associated factor homolog 1 [Tanacetum cinerariifolium]